MEAQVRFSSGEQRLKDAIEGMLEVFTIPVIMQKILQVVEDERASNVDLVNVVQLDPALTARVLATANTAHYGFRRNITSLRSAIGVLGFEMLRNLAISVSVFKSGSTVDREYQNNLWHHSFEVALAASLIAEKTGVVRKKDAYLVGLIHDLGRAILYQIHGKDYVHVFNNGLEGLLEREEGVFGANHSQAGAWFVDKYRFPKECTLAIEFHHEPTAIPFNADKYARNLAYIVYLADCMVFECSMSERADAVISPGHQEVLNRLHLDENAVSDILAEFAGFEDMVKEVYCSVG